MHVRPAANAAAILTRPAPGTARTALTAMRQKQRSHGLNAPTSSARFRTAAGPSLPFPPRHGPQSCRQLSSNDRPAVPNGQGLQRRVAAALPAVVAPFCSAALARTVQRRRSSSRTACITWCAAIATASQWEVDFLPSSPLLAAHRGTVSLRHCFTCTTHGDTSPPIHRHGRACAVRGRDCSDEKES
jgi:hypothetical protein